MKEAGEREGKEEVKKTGTQTFAAGREQVRTHRHKHARTAAPARGVSAAALTAPCWAELQWAELQWAEPQWAELQWAVTHRLLPRWLASPLSRSMSLKQNRTEAQK